MLATLISGMNRDFHYKFDNSEEMTRYLNQVLSLLLCAFALIESILVPSDVIHGHEYSHSFFYLTKIPKNIRLGFYMLALGTVEPHVFNLFYDEVKAAVEQPIKWDSSDFLGGDVLWYGIKFLILTTGPMPSLYAKFIESDFESMLMISRIFLFLGGVVMIVLGSVFPMNTAWNSKFWGAGNQRWYEKAYPADPDIYWRDMHPWVITSINFLAAGVKGFVPILGIIFHVNEYSQHRNDPIHDDVDSKYDYYDPFHFNHVVHNVAMLALASYLTVDAARHIFNPLLHLNPRHEIQNYKVVHLFTLLMHVWLVSTMVDANGIDSDDGEKYVMANWIFLAAHFACWVFQEFGIAPNVLREKSFFLVPFRYMWKFTKMMVFTDRAAASYMNLLQTTATVSGILSLVLLVIGINGPWLHATPLPGTIMRDFTNMLHETEKIVSDASDALQNFKKDLEDSDIYKKLTCSFDDDDPDPGERGNDYMTCHRDDLSTWMKGQWHPCDAWRDNETGATVSEGYAANDIDVARLGLLADALVTARDNSNGCAISEPIWSTPLTLTNYTNCFDPLTHDYTRLAHKNPFNSNKSGSPECCLEPFVIDQLNGVKFSDGDEKCPCIQPIVNIIILHSGGSRNPNSYAINTGVGTPCPNSGSQLCNCDKYPNGSLIPGRVDNKPQCIISAGLPESFYEEIFNALFIHKNTAIHDQGDGTCGMCERYREREKVLNTTVAQINENSNCNVDICEVTDPHDTTNNTCVNVCEDAQPNPYQVADDLFNFTLNLQSNPYFRKGTPLYDPVVWSQKSQPFDRWDQLFGKKDGDTAHQSGLAKAGHAIAGWFGLGEAKSTKPANAHNQWMKGLHLKTDCMRECNECPSSDKNCANAKDTLGTSSVVNCGQTTLWEDIGHAAINMMPGAGFIDDAIRLGTSKCKTNEFGCKCYLAGAKNKGMSTEKKNIDTPDVIGFCTNMKRCFYDDQLFAQRHGQDHDAYNHMRNLNNDSDPQFREKSASSEQWAQFEAATQNFHKAPPITHNITNPANRESGSDWMNNVIKDNDNYNGAAQLHADDIRCFDDPTAENCTAHIGELDNFVGDTFMSVSQMQCRTAQCDFFLAMMAAAAVIEVAAAAASLFPLGGGDVGAVIQRAAEALEAITRLIWRFFQFGLKIFKFAKSIYSRVMYFQYMVAKWSGFLMFEAFIVELDVMIMKCFGHVIGISALSLFVGFWRRQRITGARKNDVLNMFIVFVGGGFMLGVAVSLFLLFTPWAINWLLQEVLTFHHQFDFLTSNIVDIELREDVGYVFIILSSLCGTYSCLCWLVLLLAQKDQDIRRWVLNKVDISAPYEIKDSWVSRFKGTPRTVTHVRTGIGAWFQTGIWMLFIGYIIYGSLGIVEENNKWLIKGAVFHVDKNTNSSLITKLTDFFKHGSTATDMGGVDEEHSTLCDLIGTMIKTIFINLLKDLMGLIGDGISQIIDNFLPSLRFLYNILKTDMDTIMFDAWHAMQLLVVFGPPIATVLLWFVGITMSILKFSPTSTVWIRHLMFIVCLSGITYCLALQTLADTFDDFKIPIFGYTIVFTTAIFKSQICCILGAFSWLQWRFDEIVPPCYTPDCGNNADERVPLATPVSTKAILNFEKNMPRLGTRLRISSLS